VIALMVAHGDLPPIAAAVFEDAGAESAATYAWLSRLEALVAPAFPVIRVAPARSLSDDIERGVTGLSTRCSTPPFFTEGGGRVRRQCQRPRIPAPALLFFWRTGR